MTTQTRKHHVFIEQLYHFNCGNCFKWWSIGGLNHKSPLTCPHCGFKANYETCDNQQKPEQQFIDEQMS